MRDERGFTLLEILIATSLFIALGIATLALARGLLRDLDRRATAQNGALSLETDIAQMRTEADTAFAVFVPDRDVFGKPNDARAGSAAGHELDFYAKTDTGMETSWAYRYDAATSVLERYDYDIASGAVGVFDRATGRIVAGTYRPVTGVRAFSAAPMQANVLTVPAQNPFARVLSSLTGGRTATADPVGFVPTNGVARGDLYGGNTTVRVSIATDRGERLVHLVSGAPASGFTIHEALAIRAFVYRKNTHHRSFGGIVSSSRAHVFEQLQYNLQPKDPSSKWRVWCDYEIYGQDKRMRYGDPHARYDPRDFKLTTGYSFYSVTHDGVRNHDDRGGCAPQYPTVDDTPAPLPVPTADIATPPPCWYGANPCWPYGAPSNWAAPSPWPQSSPPPDFCAGHQESTICGGSGADPAATPNGGTAPPDASGFLSTSGGAPSPPATPAAPASPGTTPMIATPETRSPIAPVFPKHGSTNR